MVSTTFILTKVANYSNVKNRKHRDILYFQKIKQKKSQRKKLASNAITYILYSIFYRALTIIYFALRLGSPKSWKP